MIEIKSDENDDKDFLKVAEKLLNTLIQGSFPNEIFIVKIGDWFDSKWLSFTGKMLGEIGVWNKELRIPPFIPNRVLEQNYFKKHNEIYVEQETEDLHIFQQSEANLNRKINIISDSAIFLWFSGNTKNTLHGSIMPYQIENELENPWYVSFVKKGNWQISKTENISRNEILNLIG